MRVSTPTLVESRTKAILLCLLLAVLQGCSLNRAGSLRMLDKRAHYDEESGKQQQQPIPSLRPPAPSTRIPTGRRTQAQVESIWIHPHETASRDYFWGGWMSVVIEPDRWAINQNEPKPSSSTKGGDR